ncbi:hypothetical protein M406DRAFT_283623 [Cryphonectria parasitica EP155]|uniref:Endoplasmic reticulum junction formation protein lunapark n=1 Tax=Cryphonectria parasitica (strain ATCC 38755 / EP155) TaxID=660469 RepID=A0A9P5CJF2_CRYP1|nr:uncharacterized protein M406DRAFT_283623 [Cryphonectria parasitica EP155]KAF3759921.1 hypothetical protein M406DRAFT_283623 [Cryphonectria parasitica EP155]
MVSLWPWKQDNSSPASFERTLSALSAKIANTQASLDRTRASSRRIRVLGTLYLSFAYLVYAVVAFLVVGWNKMGVYEWTGMAGGPVLIYLVRTISSTVYELRIETLTTRLKGQQAERAKTIQKLKDATRYDSTLELLEKYGGGEGKPKIKRKSTGDRQEEGTKKSPGASQRQNTGTPNRIYMAPPPTANIQSHKMGSPNPGMPQQQEKGPFIHTPQQQQQQRLPSPDGRMDLTAEFSPNAFDHPRPPQVAGTQYEVAPTGLQNHWYDRIMDLLLGDDETAAKNRFVLICKRCRLVNGQAPPGTTSLSDLGMWKCMGCGTMNGEVDEGKRLVKEVLGQQMEQDSLTDGGHDDGDSSDVAESQSEKGPIEGDDATAPKEEAIKETPVAKSKGRSKK